MACIQGPPGTGKTRVLALIARLAMARGERILMTSHTHMAINSALNKIHAQGVPVVKIGIVSPYRAQGRTIRTLLAGRFDREAARQVVADTVERMQGQERELIILSLATGDEAFLGAIAEFFFQLERLNVSITRAMAKLIVIGPEGGRLPDSGDATIQQWIASYRDMIGHCRRVVL